MGKSYDSLSAGQKFGRLTVLNRFIKEVKKHAYYLCQCECGNTKPARADSLKAGKIQSCGCFRDEVTIRMNTTHGMTHSPTYSSWEHLISRCKNSTGKRAKDYKGRGITVCDRWNKFDNFLADMGERPDGMSIDRIDNNGNYEPTNCRWADPHTQQNNKGNNRLIPFNGKTQTLTEWSREIGLGYKTIQARLDTCKWSIEKALTTPSSRGNKR